LLLSVNSEEGVSPRLTVPFAAGQEYQLLADGISDGYRLIDMSGAAAGFISRAADHCSSGCGSWIASIESGRLGWAVKLHDRDSSETVAQARPSWGPHRYVLSNGAVKARLKTRYGGRWELKTGGEVVARFEIGSRFARMPSPFAKPDEPPDAGLVQLVGAQLPAVTRDPILLLALIVVRADAGQGAGGPSVPIVTDAR
jgi:hypothetical protein